MSNPIDQILFSLDWAEKRIKAFYEVLSDYLGSDPHPQGISSDLNPQGNDIYEVTVRFVTTNPIPLDVMMLAGEIVHHLRSVLDHTVYHLSVPSGGSAKELETTEFPIFKDESAFKQVYAKGKNKGLPVPRSGLHTIRFIDIRAQTIIEGLQPYQALKRGNDPLLEPLWVLHELDRINKHRRLHFIGNPIGQLAIIEHPEGGPFEGVSFDNLITRPLKDGAVIAKGLIRGLPGFQGKVRVQNNIPPHVAFEESIPLPERYAGEIMESIHIFVHDDVIMPLIPFLTT